MVQFNLVQNLPSLNLSSVGSNFDRKTLLDDEAKALSVFVVKCTKIADSNSNLALS